MRKGKILAALITSLVMCAMISMTALAEGEPDGLELGSVVVVEDVEVGASGHGTIQIHPTVFDAVYANNALIPLSFDIRCFGNDLETYTIRIYKGDTSTNNYELVALQSAAFDNEKSSKTISYNWDTRDTSKITEGTYTIVCTSYYYTANGSQMVNGEDTAQITIEDYHRVLDRQFVSRLYEKVLERTVDATGLAEWSNGLYDGKLTGAKVVQNIFESQEFINKEKTDEEYIQLLYQAVFDRPADQPGMETWLGVFEQGMSRTYVLWGFMESTEFAQMCENYSIVKGSITLTENRDQNAGITAFVSRLYNLALDRKPDVAGLNDWTGRLLKKKETPKQVAWGFVFSKEMNDRNLSDTEFVTLLYRTMLNREPETVGLQDWVGRLQDKSYTRQGIFDGFADSVEFANIVSSYGIK
ncbi:MAG: DUF4214 domain-containing protein [Lachnospiraceae bacterium]|nr:DUF4214 domain-containing protein [Lachnospiraceae bacterium]